ncbi:MAG: hypothetical protein M3112_07485 [Actinomycetia bacterium]|nr:hypothetical protein [Actinomycetes bacterium]
MAKRNDNKSTGNDGSWFLEAVGAIPPPLKPSETVAALEYDNTASDPSPATAPIDDDGSSSSFDGGTATSTSAFESPTSLLTAELADTSGTEAIDPSLSIEPHDDTQLSSVLRTRRPFRWPVLMFAVALVAVGATAVFWLPTALRQDAAGMKTSYANASIALRQQLAPGQAALDTITDPSSTPQELSASVPVISQLDSAAHQLGVVAGEPLPRQLPFYSVPEVAELGSLQDAAQINAAQGSDVARQVGYTYVYRTTIPQLLQTGELPTSADVQTINALSVSLASSLVEDSAALADLPTPEFASDLNDGAHAAIERYASWQNEYLTALADGDESATRALIDELDEIRIELDRMLIDALGVARVEVDLQIVELAASLDLFLKDLTR